MNCQESLYIITGKGGVGKTVFSIGMAKYLQKQNFPVLLISLNKENDEEKNISNDLSIPFIYLDSNESMYKYIQKKLKSKTLAKWISSTSFFKALLDMVPGLGQLIILGHIFYKIEKNPNIKIILDSPSTGHVLSLFESSHNFKKIFKTGLIVEDIDHIHEKILNSNFLKCFILALPSEMALAESLELKEGLEKYNIKDSSLIVNNCLHLTPEIQQLDMNIEELPNFLKKKIEIEKDIIDNYKNYISLLLPHCSISDSLKDVALFLSSSLNNEDNNV